MLKNNEIIDDWRCKGQEKYLYRVHLKFCKFDSTIRNHEHCEFCFAKFSGNKLDLHKGYCTIDQYHWICEKCYNNFKEMFYWKIEE